MAVTKKNILSLLSGILLLSLLFNPVKDILDISHQSCLFVSVLLACIMAVLTIFLDNRRIGRITIIDILFIVIAIGGTCYCRPDFNLYSLARFALIGLYWSIRQSWGLNPLLLYTIVLVSILILSAIGYMQLWQLLPSNHSHFYITGAYGNPTIFAGMLCLLISVPVSILFYFKKGKLSGFIYYLSISVCLFALPALWLTHCRSAWIAFLSVICYAVYHRFSLSFRWSVSVCVVAFLLVCWLYQLKPASVNGRILIWKVTAQMIKEKPLLGFGPHGFTANYMLFQSEYLKTKGTIHDKLLADNNHYVYNEPLRCMVEYGIIGLLLYFYLIYVIFSFKEKDAFEISVKAVWIAGIVWGFFSYPDQSFPILVILTVALAIISNRQKKSVIRSFYCWYDILRGSVLVVIMAQSCCLIKMYRYERKLYDIARQSANRQPEETVVELSQLELAMRNEKIYWTYYCYILDKLQRDTILLNKIYHWEYLYPSTHTYILKGDAFSRIGKLKEAECAYQTAYYMAPSRQKARYKLVLLYQKQGRMEEAVHLTKELLTEKVKVYGFETYEMHRELKRIFENHSHNHSLNH